MRIEPTPLTCIDVALADMTELVIHETNKQRMTNKVTYDEMHRYPRSTNTKEYLKYWLRKYLNEK